MLEKNNTFTLNPNIHNVKNTMCFKTWNDMIISLPRKTISWCCKTQPTQEQRNAQTFTLETLEEQGLDFFINHPVLQNRKWQLSGGTRAVECTGCWNTEDASGSSVRTMYNKNYEFKLMRELEKTHIHPENAKKFNKEMTDFDGFRFIEIELTNKCNMACTYCWEGNSTRWQKELGRRMPDTEDIIFDKVIELLNEYWSKGLGKQERVNFSLLGGEPFFTEHMYKFIENFIVNINDTKREEQVVTLNITTSLNWTDKKYNEFIELVKRTPNIIYNFQISGESLHKQLEYIRWGLTFDRYDQNLDRFYRDCNIYDNMIVGYGCAHNSLSFPYFKSFLEYIEEKTIKHDYKREVYMHTNWVDYPNPMAVSMIDPKHVNRVDEMIEFYDTMTTNINPRKKYRETLKTLRDLVASNVTDNQKIEAYEFFKPMAERRNISYMDVFPHFNELIKKPNN